MTADPKETKEQKEEEPTETVQTGYGAEELIKAPIEPPKPHDTRGPDTSQAPNLVIGFILVLASILVWPVFGLKVALIVLAVGAIFIAVGTLLRPGVK